MQKRELIKIETMVDVRKAITDEINEIRLGNSNPAKGNAIANLIGKLLQSVKLDIEVHRYVSKEKEEINILDTPLIGLGEKKKDS